MSPNTDRSKVITKDCQKTAGSTDLNREELTDERHKHHLLTVPHLFAIDLYPASELPPLPTVPHEDLNTHTHTHTHTHAHAHTQENIKTFTFQHVHSIRGDRGGGVE